MFFGLFQIGRKQKRSERPAAVVLELESVRPLLAPTPKKKEPSRAAQKYPEPARKSPRQHARRLLQYLYSNEIEGDIWWHDLKDYYADMCVELYWHPHRWKTIAEAFTAITTGKKVYRWVTDPCTGKKHRLRFYPVRAPATQLRRAA